MRISLHLKQLRHTICIHITLPYLFFKINTYFYRIIHHNHWYHIKANLFSIPSLHPFSLIFIFNFAFFFVFRMVITSILKILWSQASKWPLPLPFPPRSKKRNLLPACKTTRRSWSQQSNSMYPLKHIDKAEGSATSDEEQRFGEEDRDEPNKRSREWRPTCPEIAKTRGQVDQRIAAIDQQPQRAGFWERQIESAGGCESQLQGHLL